MWVGPDGAAYVTNSNPPQIFRVAEGDDGWSMRLWVDATGTIATADGFNLGGIVTSLDRSSLVVANADGLVLQGTRLTVVRNFTRAVTTLRLSPDGRSARLLSDRATDPDRVPTTAKVLSGRILYVDSKFDEQVATPPYEVLTDPFVR